MNSKLTTLAVAAILFCCNSTYSATARWTWDGSQNSSDWTDKANWTTTDNDASIGIADTVLIEDGAIIYPQLQANAICRTFMMTGGWMFTNGYTLTVDNDITMTGGNFSAYLSGVIADNFYLYGGGFAPSAGFNISDNVVIDGGYFIPVSAGVVINDDLFFISGTLDMNNQDLTINDEFTFEGGTMILNGPISVEKFIVDFSGEFTMTNNITITGSAQFINGIFETDPSNMLIFESDAVATGASSSSYINGPVRREVSATGNVDFEFPTGNDSVFAPIAISDFAQGRDEDFFTAQYFMGSAPFDHSSKDLALNHISGAEYWLLDRGASSGTPTTDLKVALFFNENTRSGQVDIASELRVAKWNGTTWKNLGRASGTGNNAIGSLKSDSLVTVFSPFTIGSSTGGNPLPVSLLDFNAKALDKHVSVSWATTSEINNDFFTVQKSLDGKSWSAIGIIDGVENSSQLTNYGFIDQAPVKGMQYYRLIQTDLNGVSAFSHIASVNFGGLPGTLTLFPNPAVNTVNVGIAEPSENATITVFNSMGSKVMELTGQSGTAFTVDLTGLERGFYTIEVRHENGLNISKILKN